ncbi:MAG: hypothetical protein LBN39_06610, partial [Planctomycetaceae bacterium]|nr:hypothetical protein [Planctomycetaceae bacterium]
SAKRKRKRRKQPKEEDNYVLVLDDDPPQPHRGTLSKELNPLGEGTRIEAAPGTLNASQIVAPSIEPTVKPELESLTGIYETTASGVVQNVQTFDAKKMLTQPDGIRQGIIWSEILKRPEW